ncbi:MAG: hypothetical protein R3F23_05920 [Verrucomicrobiia bacterium]
MNASFFSNWRAKLTSILIAFAFWWFLKSQLEPNFFQKAWQLYTLQQLNETTAPPAP